MVEEWSCWLSESVSQAGHGARPRASVRLPVAKTDQGGVQQAVRVRGREQAPTLTQAAINKGATALLAVDLLHRTQAVGLGTDLLQTHTTTTSASTSNGRLRRLHLPDRLHHPSLNRTRILNRHPNHRLSLRATAAHQPAGRKHARRLGRGKRNGSGKRRRRNDKRRKSGNGRRPSRQPKPQRRKRSGRRRERVRRRPPHERSENGALKSG